MQFRTLTVGTGESATISLSEDGGFNDLRWRHNYGDVVQMWNGNSSVTIENIRAKDDGVYECYRSGSPSDNRGVMRLIVRDCPLPKWSPPECEIDCPVCYNGGVCDDKTGICICPAGFKGEYCQTSCGSNNWGRNCDVVCSTGVDEGCKGKLFCPPDPFGCTCINGFGGNNCSIECANNHYGADCRQVCHCDSGECDRKTGNCISESSCSNNYTGPACQELLPGLSCPSGFFGVLCNYPCHCKGSADCNRNGSCDNGCHEAWAGEDCSIALPYSSKPPTLLNQTATTLKIAACSWDSVQDFGTGNITRCTLWYKTSQTSTFTTVNNTENGVYIIDNLRPTLHMTVEFYTQHSRLVAGVETNGPPSNHGSAETICTKPLEEPEIESTTVKGNEIILKLKPVSNAPEQIQCDDILRYQVRHQNKNGNEHGIVNTTDGLQTEVNIGLSPGCVFYHVDSRVVNNAEITGDWGKPISVQSAPSAPSITNNSVLERTFLLMKWNAATCNSTQYKLSYHYQLEGVHQGSTTKTEVLIDDGIVPCTQYTFSVLASYMNISSITDHMEVMSGVDYPGKPTISLLTSTSSSITLELTLSNDNPCTILGYNVLVYSDLQNLNFTMDITATSLTINENIMPNTKYTVQIAARTQKGFGNFSDAGYVSTDADNPGKGAIVGGVIGGLSVAAGAIVFVLIFVKRRRNSSKEVVRHDVAQKQVVFDSENELMPAVEGHANAVDVKSPNDEDDGAPLTENMYANSEPVYGNTNLENQEYRPIELAFLHDYVKKQNSSLKSGFEKEFEDIGNTPLYPWTAAKHAKNRTKNRYANVIPCEYQYK
ncbi:tyrosine-protein kinase receptor Tie-1-like [Anneissia japonica]|uniref:tyrosine-protein kinase receptor Tie-1-like n=1 Tax=Anneissia japonica TaxID=1529436 RepID=UPI0014256E80|nr:tyrosine-protein kinase receptor Tie-1-like [Anneissia japonica]